MNTRRKGEKTEGERGGEGEEERENKQKGVRGIGDFCILFFIFSPYFVSLLRNLGN